MKSDSAEHPRDETGSTLSLPPEILPEAAEHEAQLVTEFASRYPDIHREWARLDLLHRIQVERRSTLIDTTKLRVAFEVLSAKAFSDSRAAYVTTQRGYLPASLSSLRGASEAIDLMKLFQAYPEEVEDWFQEDPKFKDFGWIRRKITPEDQPDPMFHRLLSYAMHANLRPLILFMGQRKHPTDNDFVLMPGPLHNEWTEFPAVFSLFLAMRAIAILHDQKTDLVTDLWRSEFRATMERHDSIRARVYETLARNLALIEQAQATPPSKEAAT